mmetsp:Transcript_7937/g.24357  ORF Transcript_7937/g.24357 Transcript_7937/m.24357 type:complete len:262 (-) Transcript_7937:195-980(-)
MPTLWCAIMVLVGGVPILCTSTVGIQRTIGLRSARSSALGATTQMRSKPAGSVMAFGRHTSSGRPKRPAPCCWISFSRASFAAAVHLSSEPVFTSMDSKLVLTTLPFPPAFWSSWCLTYRYTPPATAASTISALSSRRGQRRGLSRSPVAAASASAAACPSRSASNEARTDSARLEACSAASAAAAAASSLTARDASSGMSAEGADGGASAETSPSEAGLSRRPDADDATFEALRPTSAEAERAAAGDDVESCGVDTSRAS